MSRRGLVRGVAATVCVFAASASLPGCSGAAHRIGMLLDDSNDDDGWGESCYNALLNAAGAHRWETSVRENVAEDDWQKVMCELIDEGCDIMFIPGSQYQDAAVTVAAEHPKVNFIVLNGDVKGDNIENLVPDNKQIGLIAGTLAGLLTKSGVIGFIGGEKLAGTELKASSYEVAAQAVNSSVTVVVTYAETYSDAERGYKLARQLVEEQNVDVLFGDASAVDVGAREALADMGHGIAIAQPDDAGGGLDRVIATSVVTDHEAMLRTALRDVESAAFGGKTISGNLTNGGICVGTLSDALVAPDVKARFEGIVSQIEQGTYLSR